jgi:hypothetical protein
VRLQSNGSTLTAGTPQATITDANDVPVGPPDIGMTGPVSATRDQRALAFDGTAYLLVWTRDDQPAPNEGPSTDYIRAQFINVDGSALPGNSLPINNTPRTGGGNKLPSVWSDPAIPNMLVAWYDSAAGTWPTSNYCGNTMSGNFEPTDVAGQLVTKSTGTAASPTAGAKSGANFLIQQEATRKVPTGPAIASDGTNFLVTWENEVVVGACNVDGYNDLGQVKLHGRAVDTSGATQTTPLADFGGTAAAGISPQLVYAGSGKYLAAWTDLRNDANRDFVCGSSEGTCMDIYGQTVTMSGTTASLGAEAALVADAKAQFGSPMAISSGGKILMVWVSGDIPFSAGSPQVSLRGKFVTLP